MRKVEASRTMAATRDFISARLASEELRRAEALAARTSGGVSITANRLQVVLSRSSFGSGAIGSRLLREWQKAPGRGATPLDVAEAFAVVQRELDDEPVQDGSPHRAEETLGELARQEPAQLRELLLSTLASGEAELQGGLVQCVGRLGPAASRWATPVVAAALRHSSARVRGAAIKAIELWGTEDALRLLEGHQENIPWLADHLRRLVARR